MISKKTIEIILAIGKNNERKELTVSKLRKKLNISHSHGTKIIKDLESKGILIKEEGKRNKPIQLTKKGIKAYYCLIILKEIDI